VVLVVVLLLLVVVVVVVLLLLLLLLLRCLSPRRPRTCPVLPLLQWARLLRVRQWAEPLPPCQ
jgi:hypothetical protein